MGHVVLWLKSVLVVLCAAQAIAHQDLGWCALGLLFLWLVARDMSRLSEPDR